VKKRSVSFRAINRASVVERIIQTFEHALVQGELNPGQRLPSESELTEQLGVGRTALREAMKMLEALGVVRIQQGDGTYIADSPSPTLLNPLIFAILLEAETGIEFLELRLLVQAGYCQLAARKASTEDWEQIEEAAQAWEACARQPDRDVDRLTQLDLDFHFAILEATHNPLVIRIGRTIEELFLTWIHTTLSKIEGLEWGIEGHRNILQALREGDCGTIYKVVAESLTYWGKEVAADLESANHHLL
jgi:GntR family transcriptional repressor for pyruvate dehydrogenase complex